MEDDGSIAVAAYAVMTLSDLFLGLIIGAFFGFPLLGASIGAACGFLLVFFRLLFRR